jgi:hypothetical protein
MEDLTARYRGYFAAAQALYRRHSSGQCRDSHPHFYNYRQVR